MLNEKDINAIENTLLKLNINNWTTTPLNTDQKRVILLINRVFNDKNKIDTSYLMKLKKIKNVIEALELKDVVDENIRWILKVKSPSKQVLEEYINNETNENRKNQIISSFFEWYYDFEILKTFISYKLERLRNPYYFFEVFIQDIDQLVSKTNPTERRALFLLIQKGIAKLPKISIMFESIIAESFIRTFCYCFFSKDVNETSLEELIKDILKRSQKYDHSKSRKWMLDEKSFTVDGINFESMIARPYTRDDYNFFNTILESEIYLRAEMLITFLQYGSSNIKNFFQLLINKNKDNKIFSNELLSLVENNFFNFSFSAVQNNKANLILSLIMLYRDAFKKMLLTTEYTKDQILNKPEQELINFFINRDETTIINKITTQETTFLFLLFISVIYRLVYLHEDEQDYFQWFKRFQTN